MWDGSKRLRFKESVNCSIRTQFGNGGDDSLRPDQRELMNVVKEKLEPIMREVEDIDEDDEPQDGAEEDAAAGTIVFYGDCSSFTGTRADVVDMLTLVKPCNLGDFGLHVVVAPASVPFVNRIPKSRARHVAARAKKILGLPAYSVLENVGFGTFAAVNGYGRRLHGACTADNVLTHLRTGLDGPRIAASACYGQAGPPPLGTTALDEAARALVQVLTKYGTLQEAITPGCDAPIVSVDKVWNPDGNDHDIEVTTSSNTKLGVYFTTS
jgi:hypothetical protein